MKTKIQTIDVQAKEYTDRIFGNSYFSAIVTINFGLPTEQTIKVPFTYGYEQQYIETSFDKLRDAGLLPTESEKLPTWRCCQENNIILRNSIQTGCKQKEVKQFAN